MLLLMTKVLQKFGLYMIMVHVS